MDDESLQVQHDELTARLAAARSQLDEIDDAKNACALAAANGDAKAKTKFAKLNTEATEQRVEIETLTLAIADVENQQAEVERQRQEQREAERLERRTAILDMREAEERQDIERTIKQFEDTGQHTQADRWRWHLKNLRARLEARTP